MAKIGSTAVSAVWLAYVTLGKRWESRGTGKPFSFVQHKLGRLANVFFLGCSVQVPCTCDAVSSYDGAPTKSQGQQAVALGQISATGADISPPSNYRHFVTCPELSKHSSQLSSPHPVFNTVRKYRDGPKVLLAALRHHQQDSSPSPHKRFSRSLRCACKPGPH
ncbi:hypothetical protein B0H14DRAFT_1168580 [Mycena olivaceomarginata]|nr:hypothetical protein B0H14DRAFT_1168580 [Mycena olivaceomarginata]